MKTSCSLGDSPNDLQNVMNSLEPPSPHTTQKMTSKPTNLIRNENVQFTATTCIFLFLSYYFSFSLFIFLKKKVSFLFSCISFKYVSLLALVSEFNCFLRCRCSMEMWCPDDIGRHSWDWVGPPAWGRACFNSPGWGGGSSHVKTEPPQIVLLLLSSSSSLLLSRVNEMRSPCRQSITN